MEQIATTELYCIVWILQSETLWKRKSIAEEYFQFYKNYMNENISSPTAENRAILFKLYQPKDAKSMPLENEWIIICASGYDL